jgi:hypothetical protein
LEQRLLAGEDLSWAAFTVLLVLWIWGGQQTRHLAAEPGRHVLSHGSTPSAKTGALLSQLVA